MEGNRRMKGDRRELFKYLTEEERVELDRLLTEGDRARLVRQIQEAKAAKRWGPDVVEAYAKLLLRTEDGTEIRPAAHHKLWLQLLCEDRIKKLFIIAPPESAKTTWVTAYLGCKVGFFPTWSWILASVSQGVAEKRTQSIRALTETPGWKELFPGLERIRNMKWEASEWSLGYGGRAQGGQLHPTMSAFGIGGSITGARGSEIISDDILDRDNTRTQYQREEVFEWWHNSLLSRRKSRVGRIVGIGTAWHEDDLYSRIRKTGDYVICHIPLLSKGQEVYADLTYPDWWTGPMLGESVGADKSILLAS